MRMVVLDAETLWFDENDWEAVAALGRLALHDATFTPEDTIERCIGATIAMTNKVPFTREVIEALPDLKCISTLATGYNIIDLEAARENGITVCNVPAYSTDSVAQHTLAMVLHWANGVAPHAAAVRSGDWVRSKHFVFRVQPVRELSDLTIGIIGFGDIGRRFGEIVHLMGARVLASMRNPRNAPGWERFAFASSEEIFERADIVSLHCPLTAENARMVDAGRLATMKSSAVIVNTARGGLIDESALAAALNNGRLGGALLDVVDGEPMRADNPLQNARNCWITPHIAWSGERARRCLLAETARNLSAFLAGSPRNVVS